MIIDYDKFLKSLHEDYKDDFSIDEIKDLLNGLGEYDKDTPVSTGKRLSLTKICIKGHKSSGEAIDFSLPFEDGVNLIIADNLKGKSSIFKMIQIALTGNNKLKPDVKKWVNQVILCFKINDKNYSAVIKIDKSRMKGSLYSQIVDEGSDTELNNLNLIFNATSIADYEKNIQDFFFKQFSYYSLKWTQKASQKDKNELNEAKASWKTYFKSIYLESKDSAKLMYGGQGKKVFQMLLGLELTYAINNLTVKSDMLTFNKSKQNDHSNQKDQDINEILSLEKRIDAINNELAILNSKNSSILNKHYENYKRVIEKINDENTLIIKQGNLANGKANELTSISSKIIGYNNELKRIDKEINKTIRYINDIEEYIEIGMFFSNLDIKHCPSCNNKVTDNKNNDHTCSLCNELVQDSDNEINREIFYKKVSNLKITLDKLNNEKSIINKSIYKLNEEYKLVEQSFLELNLTIKSQSNNFSLKNELKDIENKINKEKENINDERKINLIAEKAVVEYQLSNFKMEAFDKKQNKENKKIDIVNQAIKMLSSIRYESSKKILNYLSDIMLDELYHFGLTSITKIKINENFEVNYKQDGDYITFDEIAEGEQLRAKIAFYLSLIKLDIEYNFGRHTRFLIIDSPNKEEGDSQYLNGLTQTLKNINKRYGNDLQVIIGTAERKLMKTVKSEKIFEEGVYVF